MENINILEDKVIEDYIFSNPLALLTIKRQKDIDKINNYLPYSTGFEIECNKSKKWDIRNFTKIPYILEVRCDDSEQRFRIPSGIIGFICLYNICTQLKLNSETNEESGIHYHIDCTDIFDTLVANGIDEKSKTYLLDELNSWGYTRSYNRRDIVLDSGHAWIRGNKEFKTLEFRIGEMSFDYKLLVKRIIHANKLVKYIKALFLSDPFQSCNYQKLDIQKILYYMKHNFIDRTVLDELIKKEAEYKRKSISPTQLINNRVIKL